MKMSSQTSLAMGSGFDEESSYGSENLFPEGGTPLGESTYDCMAFIIYCGEHEKIALTAALKNDQVRAVWLPFIALSSVSNWKAKAEEGVQLILKREIPEMRKLNDDLYVRAPVAQLKRLQLHRTQLPDNRKFIFRLICFVQLGKSQDFKCCENTKRIKWHSVKDVIAGKVGKVWGPEVKQFASLCKNPKSQGISEYCLTNAFVYEADKEKGPQTNEEELFQCLRIDKREMEVIYQEYLNHCFPSHHMTIYSFKDYLIKYGYNVDDRRFSMLFNAFDYNFNGYIEFTQLLIGLAFMDKKAPHKELRVGFIFRFYDTDCDGCLNQSELKNMVRDVFPEDNNETINQKTSEWFQIMKPNSRNKCSYEEFAAAVGSLKLRGTSSLCRTEISILKEITKSVSSREVFQQKVVSKTKG